MGAWVELGRCLGWEVGVVQAGSEDAVLSNLTCSVPFILIADSRAGQSSGVLGSDADGGEMDLQSSTSGLQVSRVALGEEARISSDLQA